MCKNRPLTIRYILGLHYITELYYEITIMVYIIDNAYFYTETEWFFYLTAVQKLHALSV